MRTETGRPIHRWRPLRLNLSLRRLRPRNDTEYLLSSPEMAARLRRALDDSLAGRTHEFTIEELYARYGLAPEARTKAASAQPRVARTIRPRESTHAA
ncbi:MAG: hypothetical protein ACJ8J0_00740 [Longimicrobiaceae bacterium]